MRVTHNLAEGVGVKTACNVLGVPRSTYYFSQSKQMDGKEGKSNTIKRPSPPLKLDQSEYDEMLKIMVSDRFCDMAPHQIYATLLDEGRYICSIRTMYRILTAEFNQVEERRNVSRHRKYTKPELLATGPNQVWSWDITKLKGPRKWSYYQLYVIMDIFSRYVVGWMIAPREQKALAKKLIAESCENQRIQPNQLTLHADRGASMRSKTVAELLVDLEVMKTHSRPHVSNDNPYSEAAFKTLKYRPEFPSRFGSIEDARQFCRDFFTWYNEEHRHTGIALLTPKDVHYGTAQEVLDKRNLVLADAYGKNPSRFKGKLPSAGRVPEAAWINKPKDDEISKQISSENSF